MGFIKRICFRILYWEYSNSGWGTLYFRILSIKNLKQISFLGPASMLEFLFRNVLKWTWMWLFCKWGKYPIPIMGLADTSGHSLFLLWYKRFKVYGDFLVLFCPIGEKGQKHTLLCFLYIWFDVRLVQLKNKIIFFGSEYRFLIQSE